MNNFLVSLLLFAAVPALACNPYMTVGSPQYSVFRFQNIPDPDHTTERTGISEVEYHQAMAKVRAAMEPLFNARGGKMIYPPTNWADDDVNGYAFRSGDNLENWEVKVMGGYARHPLATQDAVMFLACHEAGHHLAETVYYEAPFTWAAAEGQADYYATLKCMRLVLKNEDNKLAMAGVAVPKTVVDNCATQWSAESDRLICQRATLAGFQMTAIWADGDITFDFATPDKTVTDATYYYHPEFQCRIDTYLQGSLCTVPATVEVSKESYTTGTCTKTGGYKIGLRPACWFNENDFKPAVLLSYSR